MGKIIEPKLTGDWRKTCGKCKFLTNKQYPGLVTSFQAKKFCFIQDLYVGKDADACPEFQHKGGFK